MSHLPERLIGAGIVEQLVPLLQRHAFGHALMLVCDDYTWIAAGEEVIRHLVPHYRPTILSLGADVHAELTRVEELCSAAQGVDGLIALGSGTINDLTKYAAAKLGKPYLCIATAASMNGYTSANASLEVDGMKRSFTAAPPRAVIADLKILSAAPLRLNRSGLGDTLCRSTVEADMLLSYHLLGTAYPKPLFDRLRAHEPVLLEQANKLIAHDAAYLQTLVTALFDAGDAMTEHRSSAVASQGEHMIVHTTELLYPKDVERVRHGELVAVATLSMAKLQERLLGGKPSVKSLPQTDSTFLRVFGQYAADGAAELYHKKLLSSQQAISINKKIALEWPGIKKEIAKITVPEPTLERALLLAGVPTRPYDIKLDTERYQQAVSHAYLSRDRFTFLDLAAMEQKT